MGKPAYPQKCVGDEVFREGADALVQSRKLRQSRNDPSASKYECKIIVRGMRNVVEPSVRGGGECAGSRLEKRAIQSGRQGISTSEFRRAGEVPHRCAEGPER